MDKHQKIIMGALEDLDEQKRKMIVDSLNELVKLYKKKKIRLSLRFETIQNED